MGDANSKVRRCGICRTGFSPSLALVFAGAVAVALKSNLRGERLGPARLGRHLAAEEADAHARS